MESHKKLNCNWWTIRSWELMNYTGEEIVEMGEGNGEGRIMWWPIIEKKSKQRSNGYQYILRHGKIPDKKEKERPCCVKTAYNLDI